MLPQTRKKRLSKRGVSVVIGYVLLVSVAVVLGGVMYAWMKSYVPKESLDCPEGSALSIKSYVYNCSDPSKINLTIVNNGRFAAAGYFIHASNSTDEALATIDLSEKLIPGGGVIKYGGAVLLGGTNNNTFKPNDETTNSFDVIALTGLASIEISAVRWQNYENKLRFVNCGKESMFKETINCQN